MILITEPPPDNPIVDIRCVVTGPRGLIASAPRRTHLFARRPHGTTRWAFPREFEAESLPNPLRRGIYRAVWSGTDPDDLLGGIDRILGCDYFLVWPHGVFRSK
jgi:hypothetical protein